MLTHTLSCVEKFMKEQFLPTLWKAIDIKEIEKKVERHMARAVSKNMVLDLLDSTTRNNLNLKMQPKATEFTSVHENCNGSEHIKVRMKKRKNMESSIIKFEHNDANHSQQPRVHSERQSLIKLPEIEEEEPEQVSKIRKMKERMRKYQKQIRLRAESNDLANKESLRKKKSVHSQCTYHTYDYQANILPLEQEDLYDFYVNEEERSLLQTLKKNLDKEIQKSKTLSKSNQIEEHHRRIEINVPSHRIQKIQDKGEVPVQKKEVEASSFSKPSFKFELSYIESLSHRFEKCVENGVKMITNEAKIVEETENPEGPRFKLKKERKVHSNAVSPKQKTNASQSIIYSLENILKGKSVSQHQSEIISDGRSKMQKQYQSLQFEPDEDVSKELNESDMKIPSYDFKLPEIKWNKERKGSQRKRTATDQKLIKGLDHIGIEVRTPHSQVVSSPADRSGLYSAFSLNKRTESSIEQFEPDQVSHRSRKRSLIKDYFNNYGNQFRFNRQKLQNLSNLNSPI